MSTLCVLALLLVSAEPSTDASAYAYKDTPPHCDDERASCRDGCSMDYGTSMLTRDKIATCLNQCDERRDVCLLRVVAKQALKPPAPARQEAAEPARRPEPAQPSAPYTLPPTEYSQTPARADDAPQGDELPPAHRTATSTRNIKDPDPAPLVSPRSKAEPSDAGSDTKSAKQSKKKGKPRKDADADVTP